MRRGHHQAAATAAAAVLALTACTSGAQDGDAATTTAPTMEGAVPTTGWWCGLIEEDVVSAVTDGRTGEAREVLRVNDGSTYHCDVVLPTGEGLQTEVVLSMLVTADDETGAERLRQELEGVDEVAPGPDYLGESYLAPGLAVAIMPCGAPLDAENAGEPVPWTYVVRAAEGRGQGLDEELTGPINRQVRQVDSAVGCSPSEAVRPGDDAAGTTTP